MARHGFVFLCRLERLAPHPFSIRKYVRPVKYPKRNLDTRAIYCKHPSYQVCRMSNRGRLRSEDESSWQRRAYERHRSRVKTARPTVDVNPPEGRPHVSINAKRLQLERERQARILRDNFILLKKLREIMYRKRRVAEDTQRVQWQESRCVRVR